MSRTKASAKKKGASKRPKASRRTASLDTLVSDLRNTLDLKSKSLIFTVFGDSIAPHGGSAWLGSLIRLVQPLGLNERVVRTAVYRLSQDGWLTSNPVGRKSYYALSDVGRNRFDDAYRRVYAPPVTAWDGVWHLIMTRYGDPLADPRQFKRELEWRGFGEISPGVFAHPSADMTAVRKHLRDTGTSGSVIIMEATNDTLGTLRPLRSMIETCWDLDRLAADYREFLENFRPIWKALESQNKRRGAALDPELCFAVRSLVFHDYRRIVLRDPLLPDELLPVEWAGLAARTLCRNIYRLIHGHADNFVMSNLETENGPAPAAASTYFARFGGLDPI